MMIESLARYSKIGILWFSNRLNRQRFRGARIEVVPFLLTRSPEPSVLLTQSKHHQKWFPPQEGVRIGETLRAALFRGLMEECGLREEQWNLLAVRKIDHAGSLELPEARREFEQLADGVEGTLWSTIPVKRKEYWWARVLVPSQESVDLSANGTEVTKLEWFNLDVARDALPWHERPEKCEMIASCLDKCRWDVYGAGAVLAKGEEESVQQADAADAASPRR